MKRIWLLLTLLTFSLVVILSAWSSDRAGRGKGRRLVLTGSSTIAPLAREIARHFEAVHPDVRVDVQSGGSSRGIADIRQGFADIGMVSRALKKGEADLFSFPLAHDGIGIIVHRDNPVRSLTRKEIASIYRREIENWNEIGGHDARIVVINKAEGRATLEVFKTFFELQSREIQADAVIGDNEQGIKTVAGNPYAIAYVSIGTAEYNFGLGEPLRLLALDGAEASSIHVQEGAYPLSRVLNLVTAQPPSEVAKTFLEFARSNRVHETVREQGFVPISR